MLEPAALKGSKLMVLDKKWLKFHFSFKFSLKRDKYTMILNVYHVNSKSLHSAYSLTNTNNCPKDV